MTQYYICDVPDFKLPNSKITYRGKKNGKRVQKTVRICQICGALMSDDDILEQIRNDFDWGDEE